MTNQDSAKRLEDGFSDEELDAAMAPLAGYQSPGLHKNGSRQKQHDTLSEERLNLVGRVRVRIAGHIANSKPDSPIVDFDEEVKKFRDLESHFLGWRNGLEEETQRLDRLIQELRADIEWEDNMKQEDLSSTRLGRVTRFRNKQKLTEWGLSEEHHSQLENFHTHGGHAGGLSEEQVLFIMEHGIVAFLEMEVRKNVFVTVGHVSAMYSLPKSVQGKALFPNFVAKDLPSSPDELIEKPEDLSNMLLIVRSTILETLRSDVFEEELDGQKLPPELEGVSLRRLGLAARGKREVFEAARTVADLKHLTFNIGWLKHPDDAGINLGNAPSLGHNSWMEPIGWRGYKNVVVPAYPPVRPKNVNMFWMSFLGLIERGISLFEQKDGILGGKGWDIPAVRRSARRSAQLACADAESGRVSKDA